MRAYYLYSSSFGSSVFFPFPLLFFWDIKAAVKLCLTYSSLSLYVCFNRIFDSLFVCLFVLDLLPSFFFFGFRLFGINQLRTL